MKRFYINLIVIIFTIVMVTPLAYAVPQNNNGYGSVLDNNTGKKGQILIHSGNANGNSDIGTWTDVDFLKGKKGDKGRRGKRGAKGDKGDKGDDGSSGQDGSDGTDGQDGKKGDKGDKGNEGKQGQQGVKGDAGEGLDDRINLMIGVEHEGEKWIKGVHAGYDVNNEVGILEVRFTRKIGRSYTEERMDELQSQIDLLKGEQTASRNYFEEGNMQVVPTSTGFILEKKNKF